MSQIIFQVILAFGIILTAIGGFGSYYYGEKEQDRKDNEATETQGKLNNEITTLKSELSIVRKNTDNISSQIDLIYQNSKLDKEHWTQVELKMFPPTDYVLLLFTSDKGRISGKARIKGSNETYTFSTTANHNLPIAIRNLWLSETEGYKQPAVLEFIITEQTDNTATLNIFTQGWIDRRGQEPH